MQRRAAAAAFVFFLVVAVGAWAYVGVAHDLHEPEFSVSGTSFGNGDTATIDGVEYTVSELGHAGGGGGGHGGGGEGELEATLAWTDPAASQSATLAHNDTVAYEDGEYRVVVPNASDPSSFTLEEQQNVTALLVADPDVQNELAEQDGTTWVVSADGRLLEPLGEWLPEPDTAEFAEGEAFPYENQTTTVDAVGESEVTLVWEAPEDSDADLTEGGNVTLANGERYFAHFRGSDEVVLAHVSEYAAYSETVAERDYFNERMAGLWGVAIVAGFAALLLLAVAYLPTRG